MILLSLGLALFFIAHLSSLAPDARARLKTQLGVMRFRGLYALVSALGLVLIIIGYLQAQTQVLWAAPAWGTPLAHALMPIAIVCVAGANMKSNLKRFVRHPMGLGVLIWAAVHLVNNGSVHDVVLFGAFGLYALIDMFVLGSGKPPPPPQPVFKDVILVVAGLVAYAVIFLIHHRLVPIT